MILSQLNPIKEYNRMSKLITSINNLFRRSKNTDNALADSQRNIPEKGTQILVIDDSTTAQQILKDIFTDAGYDVIQAFDGESGIALAQQHKPVLIIMDVIMPGMSGFQATRMIRKDPEIASTPIMIVSGNEQAGDHFWLSSIGADLYLTKPFTRADIYSALDKLLYSDAAKKITEASETSNEVIEPDQTYDDKNIIIGDEQQILVVDDSKTVQYQMKKILMQRGYDVLQAYDARSGIIMAKKNKPALIIMDVVMPGPNGFQATRYIRKDPDISDIPIIIISGNQEACEQFLATKLGANHFLTKPFSRNEIFSVIEKTLPVESCGSYLGIDTIVKPDTNAKFEEKAIDLDL